MPVPPALGEGYTPWVILHLCMGGVLLMGTRLAVGIVVLDLMVVPGREERVRGVHRLQIRVGLIEAVLLPVLVEQLAVTVVVVAAGVEPNALAGPIGILVDVVTQADDQVQI